MLQPPLSSLWGQVGLGGLNERLLSPSGAWRHGGGGRPAAPGARLREGTPELGATGPSKGGREAKFVGSEGVRGLSRRIWDAALVTDAEKPINRRRGEQRGGVDVLEVPRR